MTTSQRIALRPILLAAVMLIPAAGLARERPVFPSGMGLQRLVVDPELVIGSADGTLSELRLSDAQGHEIPYLIVNPSVKEAWQAAGHVEAFKPGRNASGFEADFGQPVTTGRVRLAGLPGPFHKRCQLIGSLDGTHWRALVPERYLYSLQDGHLRVLELPFTKDSYRYFRLTWDDESPQQAARAAIDGGSAVRLTSADERNPRLPLPGSFEADVSVGEPPPEMGITARVTPAPGAAEAGASRFQILLPGLHLPVKTIELGIDGTTELLREVRVVESEGGKERVIGSGRLRRVPEGKMFPADFKIPLTARPAGRELELRVEDGKNPPVTIVSATALLDPFPWIVFESSDGKQLTATYGEADAPRPQYNLAALESELATAKPGDALWGSVRLVLPEPFYMNKLLWAAAAAVIVLALGFFLWAKRKAAPAPGAPAGS